MKKLIALSVLSVLALGIAGCQTPAQPETQVPDREAAGEPSTADQQATLEVLDGEDALQQEATLTITDGEDTVQQEATLTITDGEEDTSTAEQQATLTITE